MDGMTEGVWGKYDNQIADMRRQGYSLQQIGDSVGVTRERIRQLLKRKIRRLIEPIVCNEDEAARRIGCNSIVLVHLRKRGLVNPKRYSFFWLYDASEMDKAKQLVEASRQWHKSVVVICGQCGKEFTLMRYAYNARTRKRKLSSFFCSRPCWGRYVGIHYGYGRIGGWTRGLLRRTD